MTRSLAAAAGALSLAALAHAVEYGQQWRLKRSSNPDKVRFAIERSKPGSRWSHNSDVPLSRFRNLTLGSLSTHESAKFEYTGDAGRLLCEGRFNGNGGSGEFTFAADPRFGAGLQRLGYGPPSPEEALSMLIADVTLDFARLAKDIASTTRELMDMKVHGINAEFIDGIRSSGYPGLRARDYIDLRIHGVTPALIRELKNAGYDVPARDVVQMRIHGVNPEYVRDLKSFGLRPSASEVVEMRIHGVTPEYLRGMQDAGYGGIAVREVVNLRIHGVGVDFAKEAAQLGYRFTVKELAGLRMHGVNAAYLRRLKDSGYGNLTAANIVKLRVHGID